MKDTKIFSVFIIGALLAVGVLGFLWIDNTSSSHTMQHGCPIPLASGGDCPIFGNAVGMVWHHIAGLQNSILSTVNLGALSLLLNVIFIFFLLWFRSAPPLLPVHSYRAKHFYIEPYHFSRKGFLRWLILCRAESSRPFVTGALTV
ncbi:MAG: hypothetical protein HZC03_02475 [Candidatus Lloydbacteria bacterium]|nr:hypothetical protein [Candidatus Lloydbacteria bacterium]